jgi:hypothetical protein
MNLSGLEKLKNILATGKDLSVAFTYFMDHFGENEAFLDLGRPKKNDTLEDLISAAAGAMFGVRVVLQQFLLIAVPKTHFIHGAGMINGMMATVIYFEDIQVGILCVYRGPKGGTLFSRFSAQNLPPEAMASKN